MTRNLLATTVVPFFLATAAVAQTGMVTGENWNDATVGAFFEDDGAMTLLDEAEMRTNWGALSAEDQATVMATCANLDASMTTPADPSAAVPDTSSPATTPAPAGSDVTAGAAPTAGLPTDSNSPAATSGTGTAGDVTNETTTTGTGGSNASTFGEARTGTGLSSVDGETWTELCTTAATF